MNDQDAAAQGPVCVELEAGSTYFWCRCGRSLNQPFCDGSHQGSAIEPLRFVAERTEQVWLCGCKKSGAAPRCDGTHNRLAAGESPRG
ncbi:MAG: CDGSH iron-sulfur domain-containing protein [Gammaproteobacteria bacterium]